MGNILCIATVTIITAGTESPVMGGEAKRCSGPKSEHDADSDSISSHLRRSGPVHQWNEWHAFSWPPLFLFHFIILALEEIGASARTQSCHHSIVNKS